MGGKLYYNHLRDLMWWKIYRSYNRKKLAMDRIRIEFRKTSFRQKHLEKHEESAVKFRDFLMQCGFVSFDELPDAWKEYQEDG